MLDGLTLPPLISIAAAVPLSSKSTLSPSMKSVGVPLVINCQFFGAPMAAVDQTPLASPVHFGLSKPVTLIERLSLSASKPP